MTEVEKRYVEFLEQHDHKLMKTKLWKDKSGNYYAELCERKELRRLGIRNDIVGHYFVTNKTAKNLWTRYFGR